MAKAYGGVLGELEDAKLIVSLGQRAAEYHDEWLGEPTPELATILGHVLHADPGADWAFQRLTVALTTAEKWDELLDLYDRALEATRTKSRRGALLEEAANVAKDFAGEQERAIGYLKQLQELRPRNKPVALALERLLDKNHRWSDLIDLWTARLAILKGDEAMQARERIAACWFEKLGNPAQSLAAIEDLLRETDQDAEACRLLEAIVRDGKTPADTRESALALLRQRYEIANRESDIVAVLEATIDLTEDGDRRKALRAEAGKLLATLGEGAKSFDQFAQLLVQEPDNVAAEEELRHLAHQHNEFERLSSVLADAADRAATPARTLALLSDAASVRLESLRDRTGAIDLLLRAYRIDGPPADVADVCRHLDGLLEADERHADRLDVLDRLAASEERADERRRVLGELAQLAQKLGDLDRAAATWNRRIDADATDTEAITALVDQHAAAGDGRALVDALRRRVDSPVPEHQRRADLERMAMLLQGELQAPERAIEVYREIHDRFGTTAASVEALAMLLSDSGRWKEYAELLDAASGRDLARSADWLARAGDACREHIDAADRAAAAYARGLDVDPRHAACRAGLQALLDGAQRGPALDALATACTRTDEWQQALELVEPRLAAADSDIARVAILKQAATLHEHRAQDPVAAFTAIRRASVLAPTDSELVAELERLGANDADGLCAALRDTAAATTDAAVTARLRRREGELQEQRRDDAAAALEAFKAARPERPDDIGLLDAIARLAARTGDWTLATDATLAAVEREGLGDAARVTALIGAAQDADIAAVAGALVDRIASASGLRAAEIAQLEATVAGLYRDRLGDDAATEAALRRSLAAVGDDRGVLVQLVELLRKSPGKPLYTELHRLAALDNDDLDALIEAASVAAAMDKAAHERKSLEAALTRAVRMWRTGAKASGQRPADETANAALDRLAELYVAAGETDRAIAALDEAVRWPVDAGRRRALRFKAAELAAGAGDDRRAVGFYRDAFGEDSSDTDALARMAALYEKLDDVGELLAVRKAQLERAADADTRVALRLDLSRLVGVLEERSGRADGLRKNLAERPGHRASLDALCDLLAERARHGDMADVLSQQATAVQGDDPGYGASLWLRCARVCEADLSDVDRALDSFRNAAGLAPEQAEALDGLARLHVQRDEPGKAVPWLEQWLPLAGSETPDVTIRLANALVDSGASESAIQCLETAEARITDPRLRELLANLYRDIEAWEPLGRLLTESLDILSDDDEILATAREATAIYVERMGEPQRAVTALQSALKVSPDDVNLRTQLSVGLRRAGRLDDAREELEAMIKKFGRRRSTQRAAVHHELALVARDQGDIDTALKQLEQASKMDTNNGDVLRSLAELARTHERFAAAEKAYRALLLVARRRDTDDPNAVGASEVLFELHYLAQQAGDDDRAAELRESALETAIESDIEITRARRALIAHEDYPTLLEVLEERLDLATDADAKAQTLAYLAEALDKVGRGDESIDALLRALESAPGREDLHDAARKAAKGADSVDRYIDTVSDLASKARRKEDSGRAAVLLWKLGIALEQERGDLDGAADAYARMERTGIRQADALSAQARIHGSRGDRAAQARALSKLLKMVDDAPADARADALYQLAEIRAVHPDSHSDGLEHLNDAMSAEPRYARAGAILRAALDAVPGSTEALTIYQSVARRSNDREMMLDCVERRAAARVAAPEELREAIDTATELDVPERAEALLTAAVEQAREADGGLAANVWAPLALAEYKQRRGDYGSAADVVLEAASIGGLDAVWDDAVALAQTARKQGHVDVAARTLSALREHRPEARDAWEPLFQIYSEQGDHGRLERLAGELLPSLMDVSERNALRMLFADVLRKEKSSHSAAMELYKDVLLDDPGNQDAATLYEHLLEESGTDDEIIAFLTQRYDEARDSGDPDRVAGAALRLGERLANSDPAEALDMYRGAADLAPDNAELLAALVGLLDDNVDPAEHARWCEKLLASSSGPEAAKLALDLHRLRSELGEDDAALRALELGYAAAPESTEVRTALESFYRDNGRMRPLADLLSKEAERLDDPDASIPMLMEVAQMYRDMLFDAEGAIGALRKAVQIAPQDMNALAELVRSLEAQGDVPGAIEATRAALSVGIADPDDRVSVLMMQASSELGVGEASAAVADLEEAYAISPDLAAPLLTQALATAQAKARENDDLDLERVATLRMTELMRADGRDDEARDTLVEWIGRAPHDRDVLLQIADLDTAARHWDGVVAVCDRLVSIEEGEDQIASALRLADAAANAGNPAQARNGLEAAAAANAGDPRLREALHRIYELAGAFDELAALALQEAEVAEGDDDQFGALMRAADLLVRAQDGDGAIRALDRARELRPEDGQLTLRYIDALVAAGRLDEARASLDPMLDSVDARSKQMGDLQLRRARLARASGDADGEIDALEKVFDLDRDNGAVAAELARAAEEHNRIPLAIKALRTISLKKLDGPMEPHEATVAEARLELRRGNPGKARMLVRKVVRERPDYLPAIEIMEAASKK